LALEAVQELMAEVAAAVARSHRSHTGGVEPWRHTACGAQLTPFIRLALSNDAMRGGCHFRCVYPIQRRATRKGSRQHLRPKTAHITPAFRTAAIPPFLLTWTQLGGNEDVVLAMEAVTPVAVTHLSKLCCSIALIALK
jgi:hypothetical protein